MSLPIPLVTVNRSVYIQIRYTDLFTEARIKEKT